MATTLKLRRGTTAAHSTFTGAAGEVTVDTDKDVVVVHDGATAGGFPLLGATNPQVLSVNSTSDALRITQTGTGNALLVEDSTNPDSTPFVVDASGYVVAGYTNSSPATFPNTKLIQSHAIAGGAGYTAARWDNTGNGPQFIFGKSRGNAVGTLGIVSDGDTLGQITFTGDDGTDLVTSGATITAQVDGTPGLNDMPGRLVFSTTADGASSPTERIRINSSGNVIVGSGEASATPVGNILRAPDAVGTNIAGANLDIKPGASTGSATGGNVSFYSGVTPGASGTTANSLTERMRITSTGTAADSPSGVVISTSGVYPSTIPITNNGDRISSLMVHGTTEANAAVGIVNWGASTGDEPNLNFMALNSNTIGSFGTVPTSGFNLGLISFEGYSGSGSDMLSGAAIFAESSGTWTSTYAPSTLRLQTASATSTLASRIVIDEDLAFIAPNTGFQISETTATTAALAADYLGNVFSGKYTPTLSNTTNITGSTQYECYFSRVGNIVTVSGRVGIDPTAAGSITLGVSLPISSDISNNCYGTCNNQFGDAIAIAADNTNNRASFVGVIADTANRQYSFTFQYEVA